MADHPIVHYDETGLTLSAKIFDTTGLVDTISMTESPTRRYYITAATLVSNSLAAGTYSFSIEDGSGVIKGVSGEALVWDGSAEVLGGTDWSTTEREQIRYRLQLDGDQTTPDDTDLPLTSNSRSRATAFTTSGLTIYALVYNENNEIYNGTSFVTYSSGDYADYVQVATETTGTGRYSLSLPVDSYTVEFRQQAGTTPNADTDRRLPQGAQV